eukprot:948157-Prorocentrum_minimum.AAC.1
MLSTPASPKRKPVCRGARPSFVRGLVPADHLREQGQCGAEAWPRGAHQARPLLPPLPARPIRELHPIRPPGDEPRAPG